MNNYLKIALPVTVLGLLLGYICCTQVPSIKNTIEAYAVRGIEEQFGAQLIPADQEEKIRAIATQMGITDTFDIRKMNDTALSTYAYHNAFFVNANLWNIVPLVDKPFVYISSGFLEDISDAEQRFLIGHELIHLKERHLRFLMLTYYATALLLLAIVYFFFLHRIIRLFNTLRTRWNQPIELSYALTGLQFFVVSATLYLCVFLPTLGMYAYRRHIEWQADMQSVALLHTHDGGTLCMDRMVKELNQPAQWDYWTGLLIDHPSNKDRKDYFLAHKNTSSTLS